MNTIIVPVDGATNIKLEVYDFNTLTCLHCETAETPVTTADGLRFNCTGDEFSWFDEAIRRLPKELREAKVIAPVARGASGGLVAADNTLTEMPGRSLTLSYSQEYPERVEQAFREIAGDARDFFFETGSVRDIPGSITLLKRFVFEEMERPDVLKRSARFGTYGILMTGHFLGDDYLTAINAAGNEHSYWMCHSGARNINEFPGAPSYASGKIASFERLVPSVRASAYDTVGFMPEHQAQTLGIGTPPLVIPGGHDTCLSHIPVMSTCYLTFSHQVGKQVVHLEAGSWTMAACIGGSLHLPGDAFRRDIIVQGTVDGQPVVTARYGGGYDFRHIKQRFADRGVDFRGGWDERALVGVLDSANCFLVPDIHPVTHGSGPFSGLEGRIVNEDAFDRDPRAAHIVTNLATSVAASVEVDSVAGDPEAPVILTGGASLDPYYGRLVASLTGRRVFGLFDSEGKAISETTSLGAAMVGKAACMCLHPYAVDISGAGLSYREFLPLPDTLAGALERYRKRLMDEIAAANE